MWRAVQIHLHIQDLRIQRRSWTVQYVMRLAETSCVWVLGSLVAGSLVVGSCYSPQFDDREPGNASGSAASFAVDASQFPPCQDTPPLAATSLRWSITTHAFGGRFAPRNVGAFWIEDSSGAYLDTLEQWGTTRKKWLKGYLEATAEVYVDATSGATLVRHGAHEGDWDLKTSTGCDVGPGDYQLVMELTDRSGTGVVERIAFEVGAAVSLKSTNLPQFSSIVLQVETP